MEYRVVLMPEAQAAIDRDIARIRRAASHAIADRWYRGLMEAIASLASMPTRCALIQENALFEEELRQLLHGKRPHTRRIIFFIDGDTVHIVRYQHSRTLPLSDPGSLRSRGGQGD